MEVEKRIVVNGGMKLPIGYRFHPTEQELILHYLLPKAFASPLPSSIIPVFDLFFSHPLTFPGLSLSLSLYVPSVKASMCVYVSSFSSTVFCSKWSILCLGLDPGCLMLKLKKFCFQGTKRRSRGTSFARREKCQVMSIESRFPLVMVIGNLLVKRDQSLPVVKHLGLEKHLLSMKQTSLLLIATKLDGA